MKQKREGISGHLQIVCAKNEQRRLARNEPGACAVTPQNETKKEMTGKKRAWRMHSKTTD
jgi:hypothetical protein